MYRDFVQGLCEKIISFKEKDEWTLETKYNIGKKREA